ncbi:YwdI family protein [Bacillus sp. FJAT-47783]|uniref:YwdI family protein n=1 Tax=Bacillus sp. FJAT-47783 TaxID=2922712 RepID=UPI001FAE5B93|nr:YwdI family protein [Bacillus sp. FJAT-47783]
MNIPIKNIVLKMEQELMKLKESQSKEAIEARLLVIRSLCDVVLDQPEEQRDFTDIQEPQTKEDISSLELEKMMGIKKPKPAALSSARVIEEDGANGDSIFDF